jgi:hypothetical protein
MAQDSRYTLTDLIKSRRTSGEGLVGSVSGSIKDKLREKFDPRRMFNQRGLLPALFPSLRAYQAKPKTGAMLTSPEFSSELSSSDSTLKIINTNISVLAKNSVVLPNILRDVNVMQKNMAKMVKLKGGTPSTSADRRFFMSAKERETAYKVQSGTKAEELKPVLENEEKTFFEKLFGGLLAGLNSLGVAITSAFGKLLSPLQKLFSGLLTGMGALNGASILASLGQVLGIGGPQLKALLIAALGLYLASKHNEKVDLGVRLENKEAKIAERAFKEIPQNMQYGDILKPEEAKTLLESGDEKLITSYGGKERVEKMAKGEKPGPLPVKPSPDVAPDKSKGFWNRFFTDWKETKDPKSGGEKYKEIKGRSDAERKVGVKSESDKTADSKTASKVLPSTSESKGRAEVIRKTIVNDFLQNEKEILNPSGKQKSTDTAPVSVPTPAPSSGLKLEMGTKDMKTSDTSGSNQGTEVIVNNSEMKQEEQVAHTVIPSAYDLEATNKFSQNIFNNYRTV